MAWMQTTVPQGTDPKPYKAALLGRAMAAGTTGKLDPDLALLSRDEGDKTIFMLSPAAAKHAHGMPGEWVETSDPQAYGWRIVYDVDVSLDELGLKAAP